MAIHKKGQAHWEGDLKSGKGTVSTESGALNGNKVCTAHIPVSLFGNQRQVNELDHLAIQQLNGRLLSAISDVVTGIEQIRCFSFNQFCGTHSVISS